MDVLSDVFHLLAFVVGIGLILFALMSAVRSFVVPRGTPSRLTFYVFQMMRLVFSLLIPDRRPNDRESVLAFYAPVSLLTLPIACLACLLVGYMGIFWALGASSWTDAFTISRQADQPGDGQGK